MNYLERFPQGNEDWADQPEPFEAPPNFETREISPQDMLEIFTDKKFISTLAQAAEKTDNTGYETSFDVLLDRQNGQVVIPFLNVGGAESLKHLSEVIEIDSQSVPEGPFLSFHFHPSDEADPIPSDTDLLDFIQVDKPAFVGIGRVTQKGNVDILLINAEFGVTIEDMNEVGDRTDNDHTSLTEAQRILADNKFPNRIISFTKTAEGLMLTKASQTTIKKLEPTKVVYVPPEYGF